MIITTTFDSEHWQVVPKVSTETMNKAGYDCHTRYVEDAYIAMLAAAPPAPSAWLPIESAPEGEYVLVLDSEYGVRIAIKHGGEWWGGYDSYGNDRELSKVTRWMPLPPEQACGKVED